MLGEHLQALNSVLGDLLPQSAPGVRLQTWLCTRHLHDTWQWAKANAESVHPAPVQDV